MRIVDLKTFRELPEGTLFMKYEPSILGSIQVKGETWDCDFVCASLCDEIESISSEDESDKLDAASSNPNISLKMDFNAYMRDGLFDEDQLFAIYERTDVEGLIGKLQECLKAYV